MEEQILSGDIQEKPKKEKKQRKESLLFKYGVIAFLEILVIISVFLVFLSRNIKSPIKMIYDESIEFFLDSAVDNVKSWFENQVTVMNVFQKSVVDPVDNPDHIKDRIQHMVHLVLLISRTSFLLFWDSFQRLSHLYSICPNATEHRHALVEQL